MVYGVDGNMSSGVNIGLLQPDVYYPKVKKAAEVVAAKDEQPHDLYEMLFNKEELTWLQNQYRDQHGT